MSPTARKAVASVATLVFLAGWIWGVLEVARFLPDAWWAKTLFFGAAGLGWGVPLFPLFRWAERGGRPSS